MSDDYFDRAEMRWMSVEDSTIEVPARWLAEIGRQLADTRRALEEIEKDALALGTLLQYRESPEADLVGSILERCRALARLNTKEGT